MFFVFSGKIVKTILEFFRISKVEMFQRKSVKLPKQRGRERPLDSSQLEALYGQSRRRRLNRISRKRRMSGRALATQIIISQRDVKRRLANALKAHCSTCEAPKYEFLMEKHFL
jgi:hypothetical protein